MAGVAAGAAAAQASPVRAVWRGLNPLAAHAYRRHPGVTRSHPWPGVTTVSDPSCLGSASHSS
jgi:hypothetical protein